MRALPVKQAYINALNADMLPGEKLLWAGRPDTKKLFCAGDIFLIPFSLMWGGFALFWESTALFSDAPLFFKLWGIPFVLVGLYMIIGRFFVKQKAKSTTLYAVTNKRALLLNEWPRRSLRSVDLKSLSTLGFSGQSGELGTIHFGEMAPGAAFYLDTGMEFLSKVHIPLCFMGISNAREVLSLIDEIRGANEPADERTTPTTRQLNAAKLVR